MVEKRGELELLVLNTTKETDRVYASLKERLDKQEYILESPVEIKFNVKVTETGRLNDIIKAVDSNISKMNGSVQIVVASEEIGATQGLPLEEIKSGVDLAYYIRLNFVGRKIGSLIITNGRPSKLRHARLLGMCEQVNIEQGYIGIEEVISRLLGIMLSREKPKKRIQKDKDIIATKIRNKSQFIQYLRLRYSIYDFMEYLNPAIKGNELRIDLDEFDRFSVPFGAFEIDGKKEHVVSTSRLILETEQHPYCEWINEIIGKSESKETFRGICSERRVRFPTENVYTFDEWYRKGEDMKSLFCEISRMTTHFEYRGMGLSRVMIEMAIAYALEVGKRYGVGANDPKHTPMYTKYGFYPIKLRQESLRDPKNASINSDLLIIESVANVSQILIGDLYNLPEPTNSNVKNWRKRFKKERYEMIIKS